MAENTKIEWRHTAGPWTPDLHNLRTIGGRTYAFVHGGGIVPIAAIPLGVEGVSDAEGRANVRLIAAAPALLKSVDDWIRYLDGKEWHEDAADYEAAMLNAMRVVILKSAGRLQ